MSVHEFAQIYYRHLDSDNNEMDGMGVVLTGWTIQVVCDLEDVRWMAGDAGNSRRRREAPSRSRNEADSRHTLFWCLI